MIRSVCLVLVVFFVHCTNGDPVVRIKNGFLRGTINTTIWNSIEFSSFRGIPFAKPPLGELRFQPPVPADPWTGIRNATIDSAGCTQFNFLEDRYIGEEDCLYINVYTPFTNFSDPRPQKPVMFWIFGGAYILGSGSTYLYGPEYFMEQDVVVVTFNYRVGILGFLALDHPKALGNQGLKDQYLALQWVNENIAAFGGDPNQVTLFGQSAGSASIGFHMLSDKTKGLFVRSIQMSGSPLCPWAFHTPDEARQIAQQIGVVLAHQTVDTDEFLDFLLKQPAANLASATRLMESYIILPFRPTIENTAIDYNKTAYITDCPLTRFRDGKFYKQPMLMGYTHNELLSILFIINYVFGNSTEQITDPLTLDMFNLAKEVTTLGVNPGTMSLSDIYFIGPVDFTQKFLAERNGDNPIYFYRESYEAPEIYHKYALDVQYDGVAHLDDLPYVWNMKTMPIEKNPTPSYRQFQMKLVTMYTNFAKYGNPTPENNSPIGITWTPSGPQGLQLDINENFTMNDRLTSLITRSYEDSIMGIIPSISGCVTNLFKLVI
ncbi:unnamed protein product [Xylocopa violacea]|uniref:Carboxylic ester hydrolase n=1 Tax=Xylocopa violacea TaxID=135666 RepID=A0ABP1N652_XYLVO